MFWMCFCLRIAPWSKVSAPSGPTSRSSSRLVPNLGNASTSLISSPYGLSEGILDSSSKRVRERMLAHNRELIIILAPRKLIGKRRTAATTRATLAKKRVKTSSTRRQAVHQPKSQYVIPGRDARQRTKPSGKHQLTEWLAWLLELR